MSGAGRRLALAALLTALIVIIQALGQPAGGQGISFEGIYYVESGELGFFNGSDLYLWGPYVSVAGTILNYNNIGGNLTVALYVNGQQVASFWRILSPNSTLEFLLTANISGLTFYQVSTYYILVSLLRPQTMEPVYTCTLSYGRLFVSGLNWPVSAWSNNSIGKVTIAARPSIITSGGPAPPTVLLYASGLRPYEFYGIYALYPNLPSTPVHLASAGTGSVGDFYVSLQLPRVTNTSVVKLVVANEDWSEVYWTNLTAALVDPPPRYCVEGVHYIPPSGPTVTSTNPSPAPTATTTSPPSSTTTTTVTVTKTVTQNFTTTVTASLTVNNTVTLTETSTITVTKLLEQSLTTTHTSVINSTITVTQTNPVLSQLQVAAGVLAGAGYIVVIGAFAATAVVAAVAGAASQKTLARLFKKVEEKLERG